MPNTIKILHVVYAFSAGGLENGLVNIINGSPDHLRHELCMLSRGGDFVRRLNRPVVCHELNKRDGNDVGMIFRLRNLFQSRGVDIVHTRNWAAFDGILAACLTPRIALVHGEHGRDISDPQGLSQRRNLARRALSFRAKKYVAVSRDLYGWLERTVRIPSRKLEFIPNGVDTERFRPGADPQLRAELGIGPEEFVIGSIGRLDPVKNHEGLVESVARLHRKQKTARLIIVGDGPNRARLESVIRSVNLSPKPLLVGYRPDVERLYRIFDTFVLNSFAEGMSNTLLEAMAAALPVICTSVGGNVELIQHEKTGLLVESDNNEALAAAMDKCMSARQESEGWGQNARQFVVDQFSLPKMVDRYVSLYESVA